MLDFPKVEESLISDLFTDIAGLSQRHLYLQTLFDQTVDHTSTELSSPYICTMNYSCLRWDVERAVGRNGVESGWTCPKCMETTA